MRSFHTHIRIYTHSTCEIVCTFRLYLQFIRVCMRIGACISRCIDRMLENIRVCAHAYMYVRAGCRRILLYWSRVVDHLPFSSPTLPHLSPLYTVPRPCTPCSPHLSSAPRPRVPLDITHPKTFDSPTTSSHTSFLVLVHLQWYMSCHKYVSELHSIYVHRDRFLVWVLFLIATIEFFISLSNHAINESYFVIFQKKKKREKWFVFIKYKRNDLVGNIGLIKFS